MDRLRLLALSPADHLIDYMDHAVLVALTQQSQAADKFLVNRFARTIRFSLNDRLTGRRGALRS